MKKFVYEPMEPGRVADEENAYPIHSFTTETHWACACVKRGRDGKLKAIKLHPIKHKSCRVCGANQSKE